MPRKSFVIAMAVSSCLIGHGAVLAQMPAAGSAGAGSAAVSGVPIGPGSAGGTNNSVNDPSGIGNAARIPQPPVRGVAGPASPSVPQISRLPSSRPTAVPSRRTAGRRISRSPAMQAAEIKENDRLLNRKLKSICNGC